jgi:hypothetical protein
MDAADYEQVLRDSVNHLDLLMRQRNMLDSEIGRVRQFIGATLPMVPDDAKVKWRAVIDKFLKKQPAIGSLASSIRIIFDANPAVGLSAMDIRDTLVKAGFDFTAYVSNPLSSISTTLRRMAEKGDIYKFELDGVNIYCATPPSEYGKIKTLDEVRARRDAVKRQK